MSSKKTEKFLSHFSEDQQKKFKANPYLEIILYQFHQQLLSGGVTVQQNQNKPNQDKLVESNDNAKDATNETVYDDDDDGFDAFGDLFG
jgi:hypothetical protein